MSNIVKPEHALAPVGDIDAYVRWAQSLPRLTHEEERELFRRYHEEGDVDAGRQFLVSHLRFVVFVTRNYLGYGLSQADLIQEGNLGLLKAFKRFDAQVGVRFVSFAVYWIKSEIQEFVLKNWRIVKIATTKAQRKLFFKMRGFLQSIRHLNSAEAQNISQSLEVPEKDVWCMQQRLYGHDVALNTTPSEDDAREDRVSLMPNEALISHNAPTLEQLYEDQHSLQGDKKTLHSALAGLDERSKTIITQRWLSQPKATLKELSVKHGVSVERVRQIEAAALKKLKAFFH